YATDPRGGVATLWVRTRERPARVARMISRSPLVRRWSRGAGSSRVSVAWRCIAITRAWRSVLTVWQGTPSSGEPAWSGTWAMTRAPTLPSPTTTTWPAIGRGLPKAVASRELTTASTTVAVTSGMIEIPTTVTIVWVSLLTALRVVSG